MKTLTSLFASALFATSLFASSAFAATDSQTGSEARDAMSGGGKYHQCFLAGNPGCKK